MLEIYDRTEEKVNNEEWGSDAWIEYTSLFAEIAETEDFKSLREDVRKIQNVNNVNCIYLGCIDYERGYCLYIVDGCMTEDDACPPGSFDVFLDVNEILDSNPEREMSAYITDTEEFGWLVTAGMPIYDAKGDIAGYALTDISMEEVRSAQVQRNFRLLLIMVLVAAALLVLVIILVRNTFVMPIRRLTAAAKEYVRNKTIYKTDVFSKLDIRSGDEIEELSESIKCMEEEINEKIDNLVKANSELEESRDYANKMALLANTDALTGAGSMTLYDMRTDALDDKIKAGNAPPFAIVMADLNRLKEINDIHGHLEGNNAIIAIYNMLADAFGQGGVYRIGGDEFAVLLFGDRIGSVKRIVSELNAKIDVMMAEAEEAGEEIVTAAIGYAIFDPTADKRLADVYTRADNAMYERKRQMKMGRD